MAQKKHSHAKSPGKYTTASESHSTTVVQEPEAMYGRVHDMASMRPMVLMGMEGKKGYGDIKNDNDLITLIRTGIPKQAMTHLMDVADITLAEMAAIIHTSDRTLRRYTSQQKLSQEQSERMVEMARLYGRGEEVFGNMERFKKWMDTELLPLGNKKPKTFLDTSLGINMLMDQLGRIEHGVFA